MNIQASEYVNIDNDLEISSTFDTIDELIESKVNENKIEDDEEEEINELSVNSNIKTYSDVLESFREIKTFALKQNDNELYKKSAEMIMSLEKDLCFKKSKQLKISDFFIKK